MRPQDIEHNFRFVSNQRTTFSHTYGMPEAWK
jgi:hypothetical protein